MKRKPIFVLLLTIAFQCSILSRASAQTNTLWYRQPASQWMQSLPIGNGRIGAQIWGETGVETISVNESSMWSGYHNPDCARPFGAEHLKEVRQLLFEGKMAEAQKMCFYNLEGNEAGFGTHLPLGDLKISHHYPVDAVPTEYRRSLDLNTALAEVSYKVGKTRYQTEYFSSNPADLVVVRYTASSPRSISFDISTDLLRKQVQISTDDNSLVIDGVCRKDNETLGGVNFMARVKVKNEGGDVIVNGNTLSVKDADAVTLFINLTTDYKRPSYVAECTATIDAALETGYKKLRKAHIRDWDHLFGRVSLTLGDTKNDQIPTDVRWKALGEGAEDPALHALFFQYGRYLTAAASRENSPLPIALQGFFNDNRACSIGWNSDYHLDINIQQNYWLANIGNLAECNAPLYRYIEMLAEHGHKMVDTVYGVKHGWTAHATANIWGFTAPSGGLWWGLNPTAGSWLATHLWEDYTFTGDEELLLKRAYPLLKGNAEFLLDYMVTDPRNGYLVTGPSISPENSFKWNGENLCVSMMPTCDRIMVWEIFNACIRSSEILGIDKPFADRLREAMAKLPPFRENGYGGIREWMEDYEENCPNHRHTSHLLGLYPYSQISLQRTPELCELAWNTVQHRLNAPNWEDVEWSRANVLCYAARLHKAEDAYESINLLISKLATENLFTISVGGIAGAPFDVFVFDGNAAGAAGIAEMLVQSHEGYIEFLPALPKAWSNGRFSGLCVRGGATVSAEWREGRLTKASVTLKNGRTVALSKQQLESRIYR